MWNTFLCLLVILSSVSASTPSSTSTSTSISNPVGFESESKSSVFSWLFGNRGGDNGDDDENEPDLPPNFYNPNDNNNPNNNNNNPNPNLQQQNEQHPPPQFDPRYQQQEQKQQQQQQMSPPPLPSQMQQQTEPQQQQQQSNNRNVPNNNPNNSNNPGTQQSSSSSSSSSSSQSSQSSPIPDLSQFNKNIIYSGLKRMYRKKIMPLELSSRYGNFHSPPLSPSDFDARPMVLLVGGYSVGKTSFIRYLLGRDFPNMRIGPEPTTDRFVCIMDGSNNGAGGGDRIIPGAALCSQSDRPFRGLSPFGNDFLSRLEGVEINNAPILHNITLVDTPGILSGTKQSKGRNYDYDAVMKWFAERADLIIVMFDAHKLDVSDELKSVLENFRPHSDKVRIVLNKADSIGTQQLLRVYGALLWGLGKVLNTPECCRVYVGSFWDRPLQNKEQQVLLEREKSDLFNDIASLPQNAVMRRINELVKRARSVKVHAYIIHYLRKQMPYAIGRKEKQFQLIQRLENELIMCARRYELPRGDFPEVALLRQGLMEVRDLCEFPKLDKRMVKEMDKVFSVDIPAMLEAARGDNMY